VSADVGRRVTLTRPDLGAGRTGVITRIAQVGEPLYTVRLDEGGWPGGLEIKSAVRSDVGNGKELQGGWCVELRAGEFA